MIGHPNRNTRPLEPKTRTVPNINRVAPNPRTHFFSQVGPLRVALATIVLALLPMALMMDPGNKSGWAIIPTYVAPGLVVFIFWILPFDMLMAKIFMGGEGADDPAACRAVYKLDIALMLGMLVFWAPFFVRLFFP